MKNARCVWLLGALCALMLGWVGRAGAAAPEAGDEDAPAGSPTGIEAPGTPSPADAAVQDTSADRAYELTIEAEETWVTFTFVTAGTEYTTACDLDRVRWLADEIQISNEMWITPAAITVGGRAYALDGLVVEDLHEEDDIVKVVLRRRAPDGLGARTDAGRSRVVVGPALRIDRDDFLRGDAICFGGDITVRGEVNQDVVAVLGDVCVEAGGVVGGDVAAIDGRVNIRGDASVRGEIMTPSGRRITRHHRLSFDGEDWVESLVQGTAEYNRVDGLYASAGIRAADSDSVLPSLYAGGGYAIVAKRGRYSIGARQRIGDRWAVALGGSFLRRTATDDEWISPAEEASIMALLMTEDMRDYYEEEGARGHITLYADRAGELGASYSFMQLDWMDHHPLLWSLFGGDKEFRENFSSVPAAERLARHAEFEGKLGEFTAWYALDTRDDPVDPSRGWWGRLEYRRGGDDFKGDLEYERFTAEVRRFQPLGHRAAVNARVKYGTSDGELPLMRAFYLGGLRTVRGIDHKSLRGDEMILGNIEYVVETGLEDTRTAVFFDAGKTVTGDEDLFGEGEFSSAVGLRLILDEDLHVEVAKSLNDTDESVHVWVMCARTF